MRWPRSNRQAATAGTDQTQTGRWAHGSLIMLGKTGGLKGRAARAGEPVSALDPAGLTQRLPDMPFRARCVRRRAVSFLLCARSDISTLRRHTTTTTTTGPVAFRSAQMAIDPFHRRKWGQMPEMVAPKLMAILRE